MSVFVERDEHFPWEALALGNVPLFWMELIWKWYWSAISTGPGQREGSIIDHARPKEREKEKEDKKNRQQTLTDISFFVCELQPPEGRKNSRKTCQFCVKQTKKHWRSRKHWNWRVCIECCGIFLPLEPSPKRRLELLIGGGSSGALSGSSKPNKRDVIKQGFTRLFIG